MIRVVYTRRAEDELRAVWRYIAEDNNNEPAADRILLDIGEKIDLLRDHPRLGPRGVSRSSRTRGGMRWTWMCS